MKSINPQITVLMPVCNAEKYLSQAIESILGQTFTDFEFLIIDDGSTDDSLKIIQSYDDVRIKLMRHTKNKGFIASLNEGLSQAKSDWVARMDGDDISHHDRFTKQMQFLKTHPQISIVGSDVQVINQNDRIIGYENMLTNDAAIKLALPVMCPFAHGAVIYKRDVVTKAGGYRKTTYEVEDYELWTRILKVGQGANIPEALYQWRTTPGSISFSTANARGTGMAKMRNELWNQYGQNGPAPKQNWVSIWPVDIPKTRRRKMAELHILFARGYFQRNQREIARSHVSGAIKLYPSFLPFYAYLLVMILPHRVFFIIEKAGIHIRTIFRGW